MELFFDFAQTLQGGECLLSKTHERQEPVAFMRSSHPPLAPLTLPGTLRSPRKGGKNRGGDAVARNPAVVQSAVAFACGCSGGK